MPASSPERVPLRLIAEQAKVSRMTVSLALRNDPSLSSGTRHRVQQVAKRLGYCPDPDVARLMEKIRERKRSGAPSLIAYLTAHEKRSAWHQEPTQRLYFEGAQCRAQECGYQLEEFWLREPGMTDTRLSKIIRHRGIEGAIVAPLPAPQPLFHGFAWEYLSAVELGFSLREPALCRACNHQFQSMLLLTQKVHEIGYRRIGLSMTIDQDRRVNHHWRGAYHVGQSLWGRTEKIRPLLTPAWDKEAFQRWLDRYKPDAIITIGSTVAGWLHDLGIRTPRDIGLANVDLSPEMTGMTGIDQNSQLVGAAALDLLVSLMRHNERGVPAVPRIVMVEGAFVAGTTTRRKAD
jgi:LacI family transcriptional regulator